MFAEQSAPVLDSHSISDIMSDMTTFTVRDLDRKPAEVLRACDTEGVALIRSRSGRSYEIRPAPDPLHNVDTGLLNQWLERHKTWIASSKIPPLSPKKHAELERLIAGE